VLTQQTDIPPEAKQVLIDRIEVIKDLFELGVGFFTLDEVCNLLLRHRDFIFTDSLDGL
jgi:hypothetical protein